MPDSKVGAGAPVIRVVAQRETNDCGVAALAMLTGETYEEALRAVTQVDEEAGREGLTIAQLKKAASLMGHSVKRRRKWDLDSDQGILDVEFGDGSDGHILMLVEGGWLIDTDSQLWRADVYLATKGAKPTGLLELVDDEAT
jgi:hypothetical protein